MDVLNSYKKSRKYKKTKFVKLIKKERKETKMHSSDSSEELDYEQDQGSETIPQQSSSLRKGEFIVLKNRPCKVVEMSTSKPGKHGHAKIHFVGIDIFTGKKYEDICPSSKNVMVPDVNRKEFKVVF